jgi:hypothetical protein
MYLPTNRTVSGTEERNCTRYTVQQANQVTKDERKMKKGLK